MSLTAIRNSRPATPDHLWDWVYAFTGVRVARSHVCRDHQPPFDWLSDLCLNRPSQALVLGSRGSGKSFLTAVATHLDSRFRPGHGTRILGGSKAQSAQIYEAIEKLVLDGRGPGGSDADAVESLLRESARYRNGSKVSILAASPRSVRGPHVPTLRLDEVDEIDPDLRESSLGMCMDMAGASASVTMTSTWHRVGGPMTDLIEKGKAGAFPVYASCAFEVLERCPEGRSGPHVGGESAYEKCPECPLRPWCHAERDRNGGVPLAKLSSGHYGVGALIQKVQAVSARAFEADYLCKGPRPDGLWFKGFDRVRAVTEAAEYDPGLPVFLAVDSGVFTGAVAFQLPPSADGRPLARVFWDYLKEGTGARENARAIVAALAGRHGRRLRVTTDPAGGARNAIGPTVLGEYHAEGLRAEAWPLGSVADSLALVEALLCPADGPPRLLLHPRCTALADALANYRRAKRQGQWQDHPEDPQHPHEDLVDALRGGLRAEFPEGLGPKPLYRRAPARSVF
jgi:hypothetical protein